MAWSSGAILTAAQLDANAPQEWTAYTPTVTNVPTTSRVGAYVAHGKTVHVRISIVASGAATGSIAVSLPVSASARFGLSGYAALLQGNATAVDSGTTSYAGYLQLASATTVNFFSTASASNPWAATVPHTWANTDIIVATFTYEAA
jgi:hypothetical protein